jgi:3-methylcrotonyl-CoA carboxylase alpha subunit
VRQGDEISTFYDSMISKVVVWGKDRPEAIERMYTALEDYKVIGLPTNIKFMKRVLLNETFKTGVFDTSFIANNESTLLGDAPLSKEAAQKRLASVALANVWFENAGARTRRQSSVDPWHNFDNFRVNHRARRDVHLEEEVKDDKVAHKLKVEYLAENRFNVLIDKDKLGLETEVVLANAEVIENPEKPGELLIRTDSEQFRLPYLLDSQTNEVYCLDQEGAPLPIARKKEELISGGDAGALGKSDIVKSPMPGTVVKVYCKPGQAVKAGDPLISVLSMKIEFLIKASHDAKVKEVRTKEEAFVQMGESIVIFEKEQE